MTPRQKKIHSTGLQVAKLMKGKTVTYLNPVAEERAKIMYNQYNYTPKVFDAFTLKPNNSYV